MWCDTSRAFAPGDRRGNNPRKTKDMEDLFETPELLPANVRAIVQKFGKDFASNGASYKKCKKLVKDLEKHGYTCGYGLDAEPFDLRKLNLYSYEIAPEQEKAIIYFNGKPIGSYTPNEPIDNDSAQDHIQALFNEQK